ncbi:hypothetical protein GCM10007338_13680 [Corynebacterium pelargi]|nr:hypothetical protein GCM10007338_13680 [Corynebacterium pelargi]
MATWNIDIIAPGLAEGIAVIGRDGFWAADAELVYHPVRWCRRSNRLWNPPAIFGHLPCDAHERNKDGTGNE